MFENSDKMLRIPRLAPSIPIGKGFDLHADLVEILRYKYHVKHVRREISDDMLSRCEQVLDHFSEREQYSFYENPYAFRDALHEAFDNLFREEAYPRLR